MKALILCGGLGTRLNTHKTGTPKALIEIAGKPLLLYILENLWKHNINDIRLCLGFGAGKIIEFIKKNNLDIEYILEDKPLGTGGALKFASKDLDDFFMAINGDIITDANLSEFVKYHQRSTHTYKILSYYIENSQDFGFLKTKKNFVFQFEEKPPEPKSGYINAGFYILHRKIFNTIERESFSIEHDVFPNLAKAGKLQHFIHNGFWVDVGTFERLNFAQKIFTKNSLIL